MSGFRIRFTRCLPISGERIGLTVWVGSVAGGWIGKPVNPLRWNMTWRISSVGAPRESEEGQP